MIRLLRIYFIYDDVVDKVFRFAPVTRGNDLFELVFEIEKRLYPHRNYVEPN